MQYKDYEAQAKRFLDLFDLSLNTAFKGDKCPTWCDGKHIHGDRYRITIKRMNRDRNPKSISFDFWNSLKDREEGNRPTPYDVLSCISSEASSPTNPDEVFAEYGDMKPSQAVAIAKFAQKLQDFFTGAELESLQEIQ